MGRYRSALSSSSACPLSSSQGEKGCNLPKLESSPGISPKAGKIPSSCCPRLPPPPPPWHTEPQHSCRRRGQEEPNILAGFHGNQKYQETLRPGLQSSKWKRGWVGGVGGEEETETPSPSPPTPLEGKPLHLQPFPQRQPCLTASASIYI